MLVASCLPMCHQTALSPTTTCIGTNHKHKTKSIFSRCTDSYKRRIRFFRSCKVLEVFLFYLKAMIKAAFILMSSKGIAPGHIWFPCLLFHNHQCPQNIARMAPKEWWLPPASVYHLEQGLWKIVKSNLDIK